VISFLPEGGSIISVLCWLLPVIGFSTNSICGSGSRFSGSRSTPKRDSTEDDLKKKKENIERIRKDIEILGMAILVLESSKIDCLLDIINDLKNRMQELKSKLVRLVSPNKDDVAKRIKNINIAISILSEYLGRDNEDLKELINHKSVLQRVSASIANGR